MMRAAYAFGGLGAALLVLMLTFAWCPSAVAQVGSASANENAILRFNQRVAENVQAQAIVLLSQPLQTLGAQPRRVRVLSYQVMVVREGAVTDGARRFEFFGTPLVEADGSQTFESNALFTLPREALEPYVGGEALPRDLVRDETRTRSQVHIRPAEGLTWGEVVRPEQIVVDVLWQARD